MKRLYDSLVQEHLKDLRQMVFLAGPRQVGKTTTALHLSALSKNFYYLNWDDPNAQELILKGPAHLANQLELLVAKKQKTIVVFDEIHKFGAWKRFLKGFFDVYGELCHIVVTGSSKLNVYRRSGDSLMGRYFLYRIHPLTVGELVRSHLGEKLIQEPKKLSEKKWQQLLTHGGFPEPFLKNNARFSTNWRRMRFEQLIKEDIRDLSRIQELSQLGLLASLLRECVCGEVNHSTLAKQIKVSSPTIARWLETLEAFYYCFPVRPWFKNVTRSLRKEPKYYLWDWAYLKNPGARAENFVAVHLLKAVHFWTDRGFGEFGLHYLRDKEKREVDFIVTRDGRAVVSC